jgi:hypothetical protein
VAANVAFANSPKDDPKLEEIVIKPRRVVTFRVSSLLKKLMNP